MSYFGNALTELLQRKKMTAVRLSELSGVGEPMISRYRNGDQKWISPEDLAALARHASDDPRDRAGLIKAHLLDECTGPGAELLEISVRGVQELRDVARTTIPLPAEAEANFAALREWYIKDARVREIVDNLGELLRETITDATATDTRVSEVAVPANKTKKGKSAP